MDIKEVLKHKFKSLSEFDKYFTTKEICMQFLEAYIWGGIVVSPFDKTSKVYKCKNGQYKCKNTNKYFNILTGTIFENTKISLLYWFKVIYYVNASRKGVSAKNIADLIGVTHKTAWFMLHKIRSVMSKENFSKLEGTVEVDEYYEGGSLKNMHYGKKLAAKRKGNYQNKKLLQGFVERGGNAVIKVIPNMFDNTLIANVLQCVKPFSTLYTDDNPSYQKLPPLYTQGVVVHSKGNYVNKENKNIYTNTIENVWSTFSRTINTYIHVSAKFLQNYANEVVFRYNTRKMKTVDTCFWFLQNTVSTRLTWSEIRLGQY